MGPARRVTAAPATAAPATARTRRRTAAGRLLTAAVAAFLTVVPMVGTPAAAAAVPAPSAAAAGSAASVPTGAAVRAVALPEGYAGTVTFDVTAIDPAVVTGAGPVTLTVSGTMTNTGELPIDRLVSRFQRGLPVDADELAARLDAPLVPADVLGGPFTDLLPRLEPGASSPFTVTVPLTATAPGGDLGNLDLAAPGVYPVMLNVNGTLLSQDGDVPARVGELHLWLTVVEPPDDPAAPGPEPGSDGGSIAPGKPGPPQAVAVLWPLADRPHLGTAGVFADDDLIAAISPGGRLDAALSVLLPTGPAGVALPVDLVTVVLDPMLLDELDRMSRGYRVLAPGAGQPAVHPVAAAAGQDGDLPPAGAPPGTGTAPGAPDGSGAPAADPAAVPADADLEAAVAAQLAATTTPGGGQAVATQFLDRLRRVVAQRPTVLLPYGDPDVVGLVRTGASAVLDDAVARGRAVSARVLGTVGAPAGAPTVPSPDDPGPSVGTIAVPPGGRLDAPAAAALVDAGTQSVVLDPDAAPEPRGSDGLTLRVERTDGTSTAVPALLTDPGLLPSTDQLRAAGRPGGFAARTNATAALLAEPGAASGGTVAVLAPAGSDWEAGAAELTGFAGALAALAAADRITGIDLAAAIDLATGDPPAADLPEEVPAVLPADLLDRVAEGHQAVDVLRSALLAPVEAGESDPAPLLDVLDDAVTTAASAALAADPDPGRALLDTVATTTDGVQAAVTIPSAGSYTLASASSPLVLTVRNALPYRVQLSVAIRGGVFAGLKVTDPGVQTVLAGRSLQVSIPAEVARSGTFPVSAALVTPTGEAWGVGVPLSVTSRAYGAFTLIVVGVAGSVLLLMVIWRIRQRWQARRLRTAGGEPAGPGPGPRTGDEAGSQPDQREPAELPTASTER